MAAHFDDEELLMGLRHQPVHSSSRPTAASQARANPQQSQAPLMPRPTSDLPREGRPEQRIGQYAVKRTLGEGSFGKVKLAVHRVSGQEVALKIISRKKLISRDMAGRVEREIQYLQLLRHPHIIKLYTVITTPNEIIMVLEYAGGELFDYIVKHGKLAEDKARRFFQQIVCAVEYCHRHKIVHRDLKPENLLLDSDLNVKIADFGLSNIMTDGNFLKTSCGSPNYAAPEVISGKLYAGPEVDVWSCGIILYVLLVSRLPFDDDFIPALFRKINSGTYHIPSYLTPGARSLIHKMLKVNPVQRITIQEIRQDPWFMENLEEYLKPPVEEFIDTGVDPNKAIDPRKLAPGQPRAVQEQIHQSVIGKLGKTMGYAKDDVQEALGKDEPNAIKDAYLIVRENQIMQNNPTLTTSSNVQPFLAASPPAWDANMPPTPQHVTSPLALAQENRLPSLRPKETPAMSTIPAALAEPKDPYVSKVGILTSSLPFYHNEFMAQYKKNRPHERQRQAADRLPPEIVEPHEAGQLAQLSLNTSPRDPTMGPEQTIEEQAATMRRLKPHSRSTIQLQHIVSKPIAQNNDDFAKSDKKTRTKWQFGIRSRNLPHEAMHCVYKALQSQGAKWEIPRPSDTPPAHGPRSYPVHVHGATRINETIQQSRAPSPELGRSTQKDSRGHRDEPQDDYMYNFPPDNGADSNDEEEPARPPKKMVSAPSGDGEETDDEEVDTHYTPSNYSPQDPWIIRVRWRKDGMFPSGALHPSSANSSRHDLSYEAGQRNSIIGSLNSAAASTTSVTMGSDVATASWSTGMAPETSCYVYMDVQLYTLESPNEKQQGTYLVDFKCAGYEAMVEKVVSDTEKVLVGSGHRIADKEVTSSQPFLDLTNKLVIHLAGGTA